jgi:hypothetical protein
MCTCCRKLVNKKVKKFCFVFFVRQNRSKAKKVSTWKGALSRRGIHVVKWDAETKWLILNKNRKSFLLIFQGPPPPTPSHSARLNAWLPVGLKVSDREAWRGFFHCFALHGFSSGLPDGFFSDQKSKLGNTLENQGMVNVVIYSGNLEYFTRISIYCGLMVRGLS